MILLGGTCQARAAAQLYGELPIKDIIAFGWRCPQGGSWFGGLLHQQPALVSGMVGDEV
jgi:hypothetical protein